VIHVGVNLQNLVVRPSPPHARPNRGRRHIPLGSGPHRERPIRGT
jgi:hypothetical protein